LCTSRTIRSSISAPFRKADNAPRTGGWQKRQDTPPHSGIIAGATRGLGGKIIEFWEVVIYTSELVIAGNLEDALEDAEAE
jgi:hypothetical protein